MLGMLADAGTRNLAESRAAGETGDVKVCHHTQSIAVGFRYHMQCHCP